MHKTQFQLNSKSNWESKNAEVSMRKFRRIDRMYSRKYVAASGLLTADETASFCWSKLQERNRGVPAFQVCPANTRRGLGAF